MFRYKRDLRRATINEYGPEVSSTTALGIPPPKVDIRKAVLTFSRQLIAPTAATTSATADNPKAAYERRRVRVRCAAAAVAY